MCNFITCAVISFGVSVRASEFQEQQSTSFENSTDIFSPFNDTLLELIKIHPGLRQGALLISSSSLLTELLANLSGEALTIFLPNDNAVSLSFAVSYLEAMFSNPGLIFELTLYHIVRGKFSSSQLTNGTKLTTLQGTNIDIILQQKENQSQITLNNDTYVLEKDLQAANGVIHIINRVLPTSSVSAPSSSATVQPSASSHSAACSTLCIILITIGVSICLALIFIVLGCILCYRYRCRARSIETAVVVVRTNVCAKHPHGCENATEPFSNPGHCCDAGNAEVKQNPGAKKNPLESSRAECYRVPHPGSSH